MAELTRRPRHRLRRLRSHTAAIVVATSAIFFLAGSVVLAKLQAQDLASQIQSACHSGALAGPICTQAAQVATDPIPGPEGSTGPAGPPGADSTVPGPKGDKGDRGADSTVPGPKGDPGADSTVPGPAGPAGSPAQSYTMTFPDGSTQTCTRSGGADDAPEYRCDTPAPAPTPDP